MRRTMWRLYSLAIEELFASHIDSGEAARLEITLRRILDAACA